jgi:hypothetical protein
MRFYVMEDGILPVIEYILHTYGDAVFGNMLRTNAMLLDLAPDMTRERVLARDFIEIGGFHAMKNAGMDYPLVKHKLTQTLMETHCLERTAAEWVTGLFGAALGCEDASNQIHLPEAVEFITKADVHVPVANAFAAAIGKTHAAAIAADGTVFAGGNNAHFQCDVSGWRSIVAIAAGDAHTIGLKTDGTVTAAGSNNCDQCDVGHLQDVASVYAFGNTTVCVKKDGTAAAFGLQAPDLSNFTSVKYIARFPEGFFGIREDGTVAAACGALNEPTVGVETEKIEEIRWARSLTDAAQIISTHVNGSIVLKKDGLIYKMNHPANYFAQWRDIVSIAELRDYFAILRADGSVRILSYDRDRPRLPTEADVWHDITAIFSNYYRLVWLTKDGRLRVVCTDPEWQRRNGSLDYIKNWYPVGPV